MSLIYTHPGSGKITVEGLTSDVIKNGTTVTIRQGNKIIFQITGSSGPTVTRTDVGSGSSINIKTLYPDIYDKLTTANFGIGPVYTYSSANFNNEGRSKSVSGLSLSYNPSTGILTKSSCSASYGQASSTYLSLSSSANAFIYLPV